MLSVLKIPGVVRFLGIIPGEPQPVPEEQIVSLRKLVESKKDIDPYPYLKEGEMVRVKSGPLAGVEGVLVEKYGQHMLVLSVDVLQQGAAVKIAASDVERV
jgi:transcription antitermination factor NusG